MKKALKAFILRMTTFNPVTEKQRAELKAIEIDALKAPLPTVDPFSIKETAQATKPFPKSKKTKPMQHQAGTVQIDNDISSYIQKLEKATGVNETYMDMIADIVKLSRTMDCSTLAIFNYTKDGQGDDVENVAQSLTVLSNKEGRWKKLFSNPLVLNNLDKFVYEFEQAFEQHGYTSHHDSSKLFSNFIESVLIPCHSRQTKTRERFPEKRTHLRLTIRAYTDNPSNPQDCPSIVSTITYTEDNIPSAVTLTMKYQKAIVSRSSV